MIDKTKETLHKLRLYGMLRAYNELIENPKESMTSHELMGYLADTEWVERHNRAIARQIRTAGFRYQASLSALESPQERGVDMNMIQQLSTGVYLEKHQNILITGPTGTGKSFLATAIGRSACELNRRVLYYNTARLTTELKQAQAEDLLLKMLKKIAKADLLILDDFGLQTLDAQARSLLMDVMEDRHEQRSTMVVGQIPVTSWHEVIGDLTMADALMDRWVHGAYKIELKGESMRRKISRAQNVELNQEQKSVS